MKPKATLESVKDICNMCGETLFHNKKNSYGKGGLIDAKVYGGYYSDYLSDITIYRFSFCEKCLASILLKCKIDPCIGEYEIGDHSENFNFTGKNSSFEEEQKYLQWQRWINESFKNKESDHYKHFLKGKCTNSYKCNNKAKYLVDHSGNFNKDRRSIRSWTSCEKHKKLKDNYSYSEYESETQQLKKMVFK